MLRDRCRSTDASVASTVPAVRTGPSIVYPPDPGISRAERALRAGPQLGAVGAWRGAGGGPVRPGGLRDRCAGGHCLRRLRRDGDRLHARLGEYDGDVRCGLRHRRRCAGSVPEILEQSQPSTQNHARVPDYLTSSGTSRSVREVNSGSPARRPGRIRHPIAWQVAVRVDTTPSVSRVDRTSPVSLWGFVLPLPGRLWCQIPGDQWKHFTYDTRVDLRLDDNHALEMWFGQDIPAVRMGGPWAPWIASHHGPRSRHACHWQL